MLVTLCSCDIQIGPDLVEDCGQTAELIVNVEGFLFATCRGCADGPIERGDWLVEEEI